MAQILVIYNPVAGRGRVRSMWAQVDAMLRNSGVAFDSVSTQRPGDAVALADSAIGRYSAVVALGGDGTISEVANGLLTRSAGQPTMPMGIIPMGNGDDFAKVLPPEAPIGKSGFGWQTAIDKIRSGQTRFFDVGRIQSGSATTGAQGHRFFVNIADVGFGAQTVKNFASVPKFLSGYSAYLAAVLKTMIDFPTLDLRVQFDDDPAFRQLTTITAIGNGRCFGGGFWVCPDARPDDGWLDVMVADRVSRRTILRLLPKLQRGTHVDLPVVRMRRARRVVLESDEPILVEIDGEMPVAPTRRLEIDVLAGRLQLMI